MKNLSAQDKLLIFSSLLLGLLAPVVLILTFKVFPFPEVWEEVLKAGIIWGVVLKIKNLTGKIGAAVLLGLTFGISENIFYLNNFLSQGQEALWNLRLLLSLPMHIATVLILLAGGLLKRQWFWGGLILALALHLFFNWAVG